MEFICHRINTVEELRKVPKEYGVELDLRDDLNGRIHISHNPFEKGQDFEDYLKEYKNGLMILNVKSERIEHKILELLNQYHIEKYFFLDSSFPMIKLLSDQGEQNIALRFSELEGLDTIRNMQGKVNWVWVDCFSEIPINQENYKLLKDWGYKLCLVSPELEGQPQKLVHYAKYIYQMGIIFDAICTKADNVKKWEYSCGLGIISRE